MSGGRGRDLLSARDRKRDRVRCGKGKDIAIVDGKDITTGCEKVRVGRG
jgi:hypothetical protein